MLNWWSGLRVQQKVWTILLVVLAPLLAALTLHIALITHLQILQDRHHQLVLARERIQILRRMAVDVEDAFRGFLLTQQPVFLRPLEETKPKLQPAFREIELLVQGTPELTAALHHVNQRLNELLQSKETLIEKVRAGHLPLVFEYVKSGQGLLLSDTVKNDLRIVEDRLDLEIQRLGRNEAGLAQMASLGLLLAAGGGVGLGLIGAKWLARSITGPLATLQASVTTLGMQTDSDRLIETMAIRSSDEIGQLAKAYQQMAERIKRQIHELEALSAIGHDINSIGPDGLDGVLRRITDWAALLLHADVCLIMSRHDHMGCWVVEAASGQWHAQLYKSVMLWEEFPLAVQSFETRQAAFGDHLKEDRRPEVVRRNLIGDSILSVPLLSQGQPFGVLVLLHDKQVPKEAWNVRLATGFADDAAVAIANARMFEEVKQKGKRLRARLHQLEHLAETVAHDLKAPGERLVFLSASLLSAASDKLTERERRWLGWIDEIAKDLNERVLRTLEVAQVAGLPESLEAVDAALVLEGVLKARASDIEERHIRISTDHGWPLVACHHAYLRQVFDNLISNAIKFAGDVPMPRIHITATRTSEYVEFSVSDNGPGVPLQHRDRVFEPFVRLHSENGKGSGIGLAIVRRIVSLYGGRVRMDSNEAGGCTVRFTLPNLGDLTRSSTSRTGHMKEQADRRELPAASDSGQSSA